MARFGVLKVKFVELGIVCATVPGASSTAANALFTTAYNSAVVEFGARLNAGTYGSNPLTSTLKARFIDVIRGELRTLAGTAAGVVRLTTGTCLGGIPNTAAQYCKKED